MVDRHGIIIVVLCASQPILAAMLDSITGRWSGPADQLTRYAQALIGAC